MVQDSGVFDIHVLKPHKKKNQLSNVQELQINLSRSALFMQTIKKRKNDHKHQDFCQKTDMTDTFVNEIITNVDVFSAPT